MSIPPIANERPRHDCILCTHDAHRHVSQRSRSSHTPACVPEALTRPRVSHRPLSQLLLRRGVRVLHELGHLAVRLGRRQHVSAHRTRTRVRCGHARLPVPTARDSTRLTFTTRLEFARTTFASVVLPDVADLSWLLMWAAQTDEMGQLIPTA